MPKLLIWLLSTITIQLVSPNNQKVIQHNVLYKFVCTCEVHLYENAIMHSHRHRHTHTMDITLDLSTQADFPKTS